MYTKEYYDLYEKLEDIKVHIVELTPLMRELICLDREKYMLDFMHDTMIYATYKYAQVPIE